MKIEDLSILQIKKVISKYNKALKISGYSKLKKEDLIKRLKNHPKLTIIETENNVKFKVKPDEIAASEAAAEPKQPRKKIKKKSEPKAEQKTESRQEKFNRITKNMTPGQVFSYNQSQQGVYGSDVSQKELDKAKKEQDIKLKSMYDDLKKFINDGAIYSKSKIFTNKNNLEDVINSLSGDSKYKNTDIYKKGVEKLKGKKAKPEKKELEEKGMKDMNEKERVEEIFKDYGQFQKTLIYSFISKKKFFKNNIEKDDLLTESEFKKLINLILGELKKNIDSYAVGEIMEFLNSYVDRLFKINCQRIVSDFIKGIKFMEQKKKAKNLPYGEKTIKAYLGEIKKRAEQPFICMPKEYENLLKKVMENVKINPKSKRPIYPIFLIRDFLKNYGKPPENFIDNYPDLQQQKEFAEKFLKAYEVYYKKK